MASGINYDNKIKLWKNRLLDLSKRNKMLNYRDTKRGGLRILEPAQGQLWSNLVLTHGGKLVFPLPDVDDDQLEISSDISVRKSSMESWIQTNQTPLEQQKTLKALRNKAKSFQEEQGVNALYLGFGLLDWKEKSSRGGFSTAPLVLVPVTIECESLTTPFILRVSYDEPIVNPTLTFLLQRDYGIEMPKCDFDKQIGGFLEQVEERVASLGWQVNDGAVLSLFSFQKIKMHNDIE